MTQVASRYRVRDLLFSALLLIALSLGTALLLTLNGQVAEAQEVEIVLDRGKVADGARLMGLADFYLTGVSVRGRAAEAKRWTALADHALGKEGGGCEVAFRTRPQEAEAARLAGQAEHYLGMSADRFPIFNRGRIADSMRLAGIASRWDRSFELASAGLACLGGR